MSMYMLKFREDPLDYIHPVADWGGSLSYLITIVYNVRRNTNNRRDLTGLFI